MQWWMKSNVVCVSNVFDVDVKERRKEEKIWGGVEEI